MKVGVAEAPLHSRFGAMTAPEMGYRTARLTGADSYWLPDHLNAFLPRAVMTPKYSGIARVVPDADAFLEPWTTLGSLAGRHRFSRTRLGTCVTDTARRNGRDGTGRGDAAPDDPRPGNPRDRNRGARRQRAVWGGLVQAGGQVRGGAGQHPRAVEPNGQLVSRDSEFFPLRNAMFTLPPVKGTRPEIWIAAHGPRMLRATGRYADAWFPVAIFSPERYADGLQQGRAAADNADRDPLSIIAANTQFVVTGRSSAEVEEASDSVPVRAYSLLVPDSEWAKHGARHPMGEGFTGFQDILPQLLDEATVLSHVAAAPLPMIRQCLLSGTPDEVLDQLAAYRDHGVRYPVLLNASPIQPKLSRGLSTALPFMRILRGIRKM